MVHEPRTFLSRRVAGLRARRSPLLATVARGGRGGRSGGPDPAGPGPRRSGVLGAPATPRPISAPKPPQHPFMAANPRNNIHNDPYMTDTYRGQRAAGEGPGQQLDLPERECASVTFDRQGSSRPCAWASAPSRSSCSTRSPSSSSRRTPCRTAGVTYPGGGLQRLQRGRLLLPRPPRPGGRADLDQPPLRRRADRRGQPGFRLARDYDLTRPSAPRTRSSRSSPTGPVGWCSSPRRRRRRRRARQRRVRCSTSTRPSRTRCRRRRRRCLRRDREGDLPPRRHPGRPAAGDLARGYANTGEQKPGQVSAGCGTTPTVMGRRWVSITDNADPMQRRRLPPGRRRARRPRGLLGPGLLAWGERHRQLPHRGRAPHRRDQQLRLHRARRVEGGGVTTPGIERVDIDATAAAATGSGRTTSTARPPRCRSCRWPTGWSTRSQGPGAAGPAGPRTRGTSARSTSAPGKLVYRVRYGTGLGFNVNYAPGHARPRRYGVRRRARRPGAHRRHALSALGSRTGVRFVRARDGPQVPVG